MQSAKLVLKRAWAQLDAETLAYKPFTPDEADGIPPKRTRQYLFPALFAERAVSGAMVNLDREVDDELADLAMRTVAAHRGILAECVGWHQEMVVHYNALRRTSEGLFLGESSEAKLLKPALGAANLRRDNLSTEERARIVRARVDGMRGNRNLLAATLADEIRRERAGYQLRLDTSWAAATINDPAQLSRPVREGFAELTHEFSAEKVDTAIVLNESAADQLWESLVASDEVDTYAAPRSLQLTGQDVVDQPALDRETDSGVRDNDRRPLDRSIAGRITRMLGNEDGLTATANAALGSVIEASASQYGLARRESRVVLLLGQYLCYSLSEKPQDAGNPGARAVTASWMRGGLVKKKTGQDNPRYDAARSFADGGAEEYYLARLWGRLLRAEILDRVATTPLTAWTEILGATKSTREHIRTVTTHVSQLPPPPGYDDGPPTYLEPPTEIELIVSIIDLAATDPSDAHRLMARMNAYSAPFDTEGYFEDRGRWNSACKLYAGSVNSDTGWALDTLPSFPEAIMRIQRFAAGG
jgi:hypothetical protein